MEVSRLIAPFGETASILKTRGHRLRLVVPTVPHVAELVAASVATWWRRRFSKKPTQDQLDVIDDVLTGDSFFHLAGYGDGALPGLNLCGAGRVVCLIDPVGDVYACPFAIHDAFLAGNVRGPGGFAQVWRESDLFRSLREPTSGGACEQCSAWDECRGGCMAAKFFTGLPLDGPAYEGAHHSLADELLTPSVIYAPAIAALLRVVDVRAVAHITGGGLPGNLNRALPPGLDAVVETGSWEIPNLFAQLERAGQVPRDEMYRTFNMGVGMVVITSPSDANAVIDSARAAGINAWSLGRITRGSGQVLLH